MVRGEGFDALDDADAEFGVFDALTHGVVTADGHRRPYGHAAVNRLTALYRTTSFAQKAVFALVVSGYSGGDIVASQIVSALNMNKGFWLPPQFCLLETANDKGEAERLPGIEERVARFAENIWQQLSA